MKPTLLVLAAGMGSRYGGLKQMDPMGPNGETVLDYSVYDAIRAGFGGWFSSSARISRKPSRQGVGARFADRIAVDYVFQKLDDLPAGFSVPEGREKPWGTAHAVRAARHAVKEHFAVINADDFYGHDAYVRAAAFFDSLPEGTTNEIAWSATRWKTRSPITATSTAASARSMKKASSPTSRNTSASNARMMASCGNALDGNRHVVPDGSLVSMNFWAFGPAFFTSLRKPSPAS
jgi:hypothetical protein